MPEEKVAIDWQRVAEHAVALQSALIADEVRRRALVADAIVEYGQPFVDTLDMFARNPVIVSAVGLVNAEFVPAVLDQAREMLAGWIVGERLTARADEGERRVLAARELLARDSDDSYLARLVAVAILRLPDGHSGRDEAFAAAALRRHLDRSRNDGDAHEQTISAYYLLRHELEPPASAAELINEIHALLPDIELKLRRDFLRAAHDYSVVQAGDALRDGRYTGSGEERNRN